MPNEKRYQLEDLEVREVSVVDRGANKRNLLVVKNQDGDPTMPKDATAPAEQTPDPIVQAQADKATSDTDLIVSLPEPVRDAIAKVLGDIGGRVGALGEAVKAASPGEGGVSEKFKGEVLALSSALRRMVGAEKTDDIAEIEKTILAEAYPAAMQQGYMMGQEAPEYVMTDSGLMMKMPAAAMKQMAAKYAMEKLYDAEDALFAGDYGKVCVCVYVCLKALGPFLPDDGGMPQQMAYAMKAISLSDEEFAKQYAFNQPQPSVAAGVPDSHPPVNMEQPGSGAATTGNMAKAGRKIAGARLSKLEELLAQLGQVVTDLKPEPEPAAPVAKSEGTEISPALRSKFIEMAEVIKAQSNEIKVLKSARPTGHAAEVGGDSSDKPKSGKVLWPDDLNDLNEDSDLD